MNFARLRDWTEPAHPSIIRLYDDLILVYRAMRERQRDVDAAFDRVAAQIGYIVTTTLPVRVEVGEKGVIKKAGLEGEALQGTLFEKEMSGFVEEFSGRQFANVQPGVYRFYLIWYDALRLKLRRDWMEPAHVVSSLLNTITRQQVAVRPEVMEPPHWLDPGIAIAIEDVVVISAIDEVYPELKLAERIAAERLAIRRIRPEVMEPAHIRPEVMEPVHFRASEFFGELKSLLAKYRQ